MVYAEAPELVTFMTFGILSIIAGFLTLFLPETLNHALPDTVRQANHLGGPNDQPITSRRSSSKKHSLLGGRGSSTARRGSNDSLHGDMDEVGYGKSPEWVEVREYLFMTCLRKLATLLPNFSG